MDIDLDVPHSMNRYEAPKTKPLINLQLSSWELNLVNEALVDIMVSKCPSVYPEEADDLKTYISDQIALAPTQSSMNPQFLDAYANLIRCLELSERDRKIAGPEVEFEDETNSAGSKDSSQDHFDDAVDKNSYLPTMSKSLTNAEEHEEKHLESEPRKKIDSIVPNEVLSNDKSTTTNEEAQVPTKTSSSITTATAKSIETAAEEPGIFGAVGHLFSKLYENTVDVFSWFGRKKRHTEYEEKKHVSQIMQDIKRHNAKRLILKNRKLKSQKRFNKVAGSVMSSKIHFNEMLDSMRFIAHASCPSQLEGVTSFVNDAISEMLFYIYEDLKNVEVEGQKLSVDLSLQKRVQKCVKVKQSNKY